MNRRAFIREGSFALLALGLPPAFLSQPLLARSLSAGAKKKTLICIFQRGAVDGLSMVVPYGEEAYYGARRSTAILQPGRAGGALDVDGLFGFHPALAPLHQLYGRRELLVLNAVGSPHPTRSHFDAQDFMESGTPGVKSTRDGWLNRVLAETPCDCDGRTLADARKHAADHRAGQVAMATLPALRGVAMGAELPRSLRGRHPALAIQDLARFGVRGGRDAAAEETFRTVYAPQTGDVVSGAADDAFAAVEVLRAANPLQYRPAAHVRYPTGEFGRSLQQIAQLLKAGVGVEIAFADLGGWDTHRAQGAADGQLANRLRELAQGIRALHDDLGDRMEDVVILTMSEFGRTVRENGTGGTDHGHANCMLVLGGGVRGGRVAGRWPGLEREQLNEGRDLALTTDFRDVFAELATRHLGARRPDALFPGYAVDPARFTGIIG